MECQEKIQRLAERMKVSAEEAAKALDAAGGDLLDAALLLERGRAAGERVVHTHSTAAAAVQLPTAAPGEKAGTDIPTEAKAKEIAIAILTGLLNHPILNGVEITYKGKRIAFLPAGILAALLLVRFWIAPVLFVVGLAVGWSFLWSGPQWNNATLNNAWGRLEQTAARWREKMKNERPHD